MERMEATATEARGEEQQRMNDAHHGLLMLQKEFESRLQAYGELRSGPQGRVG